MPDRQVFRHGFARSRKRIARDRRIQKQPLFRGCSGIRLQLSGRLSFVAAIQLVADLTAQAHQGVVFMPPHLGPG